MRIIKLLNFNYILFIYTKKDEVNIFMRKERNKETKERRFYNFVAVIMLVIMASIIGPKTTIIGIIFLLILKLLRFLDLY